MRRNDELALLYEKIKIQQSVLNKGEVQYNQRLEDIRVLKLEIRKLRREKTILQKSVANVDDLRYDEYLGNGVTNKHLCMLSNEHQRKTNINIPVLKIVAETA